VTLPSPTPNRTLQNVIEFFARLKSGRPRQFLIAAAGRWQDQDRSGAYLSAYSGSRVDRVIGSAAPDVRLAMDLTLYGTTTARRKSPARLVAAQQRPLSNPDIPATPTKRIEKSKIFDANRHSANRPPAA